jgi:hypothetical protein
MKKDANATWISFPSSDKWKKKILLTTEEEKNSVAKISLTKGHK